MVLLSDNRWWFIMSVKCMLSTSLVINHDRMVDYNVNSITTSTHRMAPISNIDRWMNAHSFWSAFGNFNTCCVVVKLSKCFKQQQQLKERQTIQIVEAKSVHPIQTIWTNQMMMILGRTTLPYHCNIWIKQFMDKRYNWSIDGSNGHYIMALQKLFHRHMMH